MNARDGCTEFRELAPELANPETMAARLRSVCSHVTSARLAAS
jgi:hypothetical protein